MMDARKLCDTPGCTKSTHFTRSRSRSLRAEGPCEVAGREVIDWREDDGVWSAVVDEMLVTARRVDGPCVEVVVHAHPSGGTPIASTTIETRWEEIGQRIGEALARALKGQVLR